MNETQVTMVGRLVTAVTRVMFEDGGIKASFRMASTERRFDRRQQQWVDGAQLFFTVVCWRNLAEHVLATLGVGDPVMVRGKIRARDYEKDGHVVSVVEIEANAVGPDLAWCTANVVRRKSRAMLAEPPADAEPVSPAEQVGGAQPGSAGRPFDTAAPVDADAALAAPDSEAEAPTGVGGATRWDSGPLVREYVEQRGGAQLAEPHRAEAAVGT